MFKFTNLKGHGPLPLAVHRSAIACATGTTTVTAVPV